VAKSDKPRYEVHVSREILLPGKRYKDPLTETYKAVASARDAAKLASKIARTSGTNKITTTYVYDVQKGRNVLGCRGPAIYNRKKQSAKRSFALCQMLDPTFRTAIRGRKKRK
jgi:hypothetical protein